ncbi:hypothetical protein FOMG_16479 [Fusarium oxysporum f. sp. melonis 26406]|uniref:Dienelactone hydrolase domain-containing protein n=1 Tax=Fusarium oxysporum f. sp. melonis 26406 TaxID=1089452 RepID=X0A1A4_FUSOX|nr:hypothetical protein FOMG_16479 [Fusarium oxysporum f. sp. melonis 26406]
MSSSTKVSFLSNGIKVVGDLYSPAPATPDRRGAALVIGHPFTGVKEQTATLYAKYFAQNGFYALAFDAAYQGESEGEPRSLENPAQRVEDFKSAITYLTTLTGKVDPERIGAVGVCAGGGYACAAAASDVRIKAVVPIVPFCTGRAGRHNGGNESDKFNPEAIVGSLKLSADTRNAIAQGKLVEPITMTPDSLDQLPPDASFMRKGFHYYKGEGFHPRSTGKVHPLSFDHMVTFDSFAFNNLISPRPMLVFGGETAETLHFAKTAYERANEPKKLVIVKDKGHFDLYSDASEVGSVATEWLTKYLCN